MRHEPERLARLARHIRSGIDTNITSADLYKGVGLLHRQSKASANLVNATTALLAEIALLQDPATEDRMLHGLAAAVATAATKHKLDIPDISGGGEKFDDYLEPHRFEMDLRNVKLSAGKKKN